MNRKLLALAVGAALSMPLLAQAAPMVYGQLNLSVDYVDDSMLSGHSYQVNSNASRIGVKGEESLGSGLSAVYMIEWGVSGDGNAADLKQRNRFLGLKSNDLGTVRLGRYDTPLKMAEGNVDVFNDQRYADMGDVNGARVVTGQNRMNAAIGYTSPKIADALTFDIAVQPRQDIAGRNQSAGTSMSASYDDNGMHLALAGDLNVQDGTVIDGVFVNGASPDLRRDAVRLVGTATTGDLMFGALLQKSKASNKSTYAGFDVLGDGTTAVIPTGGGKADQDAVLLSAAFKVDKQNTVKGELGYNKTKFDSSIGSFTTKFVGLGFDHNFTVSTKVYALAAYRDLDPNDTLGGGSKDLKRKTVSVGMLTLF